MATVGIALTTFGNAPFVSDCIASLTSQTFKDWECAVVYNPLECETVLARATQLDSRYRLIASAPVHPCRARNMAFEHVGSPYCISLDGDDALRLRYVERLFSLISSDPKVTVAHSATEYIGDASGILNPVPYSPRLLAIRNMIVSSAMFRRTDFEGVGGYDEALTTGYEDWELWISLLKHGGDVAFSPFPDFLYRQHASSRSRRMSDDERRAAKEYIFLKHADFCWAGAGRLAVEAQKELEVR